MRKSVLTLLIVAMFITVIIPGVSAEDIQDGANDNGKIVGYISHGSAPEASPNKMTITVYEDIEGTPQTRGSFSAKLGNDGKFEVPMNQPIVETNQYYIEIIESGYDVLNVSDCMTKRSTTSYYDIALNKAEKSGNDYCISSGNHLIVMTKNEGSLEGDVTSSSGDNPKLNGVKITLFDSDNKEKYVTFTNNQGHYKFTKIEKGEYKLVASSKGFKSAEIEEVKVSSAVVETQNIQMDPDESIDLAHWMTIGAAGASIILLLAVSIYIVRSRR